jgi:colanic acid biosynthesis glycosyl transferase WcaI
LSSTGLDKASGSGQLKILFLGINYAPEMIGTAVYTTGLAEAMSNSGHDVTVVTALPYYPAWKVTTGWPRYRYSSERPEGGPWVIHCPLYVPAEPTGARRMLHYATFALSIAPQMFWRAIRQRPDLVVVIAPSLVSAPVGWLSARLAGAKCWLHIQDFEVEAAFATGLLKEDSQVGRMARNFERWILNRFDRISSISLPMLAKLKEKGVAAGKIFELRNWANLNKVILLEGPSPLKAELGISAEHVVVYSGNIANKQGLNIIPETARLLMNREDFCFVVCGEGPYLGKLKEAAEGLENVLFFPLQPIERLSDLLGMADLHILPQISGAADLVLPSKLTNMLASGRPVVATAEEGTALAEEVNGCGCVVNPGDAEAMAGAIEGLLDDPEARRVLGAAARQRAYERWDMRNILGRFESEIAELTGRVPTTRDITLSKELRDS